ncbi:CPBP family glutamic-type intramembrane protease [Thalassotalea sp. G2M2-11]|uniref:CPBP family glutamic-type intramembrane protease n=1 Tax=Thalassotalea sp. G2M2-11 TaxID=2787627 RepID=UPI0019D15B55|nr:CPBP family glutamic-type intramembrane protease [Thalassotalea sp. G2M2-11]
MTVSKELGFKEKMKCLSPVYRDIVVCTFMLVLIKVTCSIGFIFYHNMTQSAVLNYSLIFTVNDNSNYALAQLLKALITSPVIETLLYFHFTYWLINKFKIPPKFYIVLSALLFSSAHMWNIAESSLYTFFLTSLGGLVFSFNYHRQYSTINQDAALASTTFIHMLANGIVLYY